MNEVVPLPCPLLSAGLTPTQLSALAARAKQSVELARADGERLVLAAQSKHDEALHHLELLKRAGEDSWDEVKTIFETSWTELHHALAPR